MFTEKIKWYCPDEKLPDKEGFYFIILEKEEYLAKPKQVFRAYYSSANRLFFLNELCAINNNGCYFESVMLWCRYIPKGPKEIK